MQAPLDQHPTPGSLGPCRGGGWRGAIAVAQERCDPSEVEADARRLGAL
eukprot:CAMPEP_0206267874 /NCGR_PEP_ID=MMETSP0047_2-20121206/31389_1 /ASSEMBLY_ACC=CAM_ASM_000192 /TAXON_ID=195065 /ORGANISM="Chroomonas mesostigmatica_cf, Strain CCMP1168" /LENGTH=48 /DNA_ID= /DNA_START= /DNA_END= /DNA_ORIENTATION=